MLNHNRIAAYFTLILGVFFLSLAFVPVQSADIAANKAVIQRYTDEIWVKGNLKAADDIIAGDFLAHFTDKPDEDWNTYATNTIGWIREQFSTVKIVSMAMIAEGDWVASAGLWGGTPTAGGKEILVSDIDFFRIENDKIAEFWALSNTVSMNQQFGFTPANGEVAAEKPWNVMVEPATASPAEIKARLFVDTLATNFHDVNQVLDDYTPDAAIHWISANVELKGSAALREAWDTTPIQHRVAPRIIVVEGNLSATRYTMFPYMEGGPALRTEMAVFNRFEGDKMAEEWAIWDEATLQLQQESATSK